MKKSKEWVSEMEMKYEFGKKEKEIEFLHEKARQEKLIWGFNYCCSTCIWGNAILLPPGKKH